MAKAPVAGRVKTRLAREIGPVAAAWWFRHQLRALLRRLEDPRWSLLLAVSPDRSVFSNIWPSHLPRVGQGHGDLGARMRRLLRAQAGAPICVIGADVPGIRRAHVARAFRALASHDAVLGPASDGGYWLIGLGRRTATQGILEGVRWSSPHARDDTLQTLAGLSVAMIDELADVDEAADLPGPCAVRAKRNLR